MDVWIVWRPECSSRDDEYILNIYKSEHEALKECNECNLRLSKNYEIIEPENILIMNSDMILKVSYYDENEYTTYYCTKTTGYNTDINELYFLMICELAGAESYCYGESWLSVHTNKKSAIDNAMQYYNDEHNSKNCDYCEQSTHRTCKKDLLKNLNGGDRVEFYCGHNDCEYASFQIWNKTF